MIPHTYADWLRCITVDCGIQLTSEDIAERLRELAHEKHPKTGAFIRLYSHSHKHQPKESLGKLLKKHPHEI